MTFHKAPSCGAMLQAWALKTVLTRMGHTVEFPDCNDVGVLDCRWPCCRPRRPGLLKNLRSGIKDLRDNLFTIGVFHPMMQGYRDFRSRHLPERTIDPAEFAGRYDCVVFGSDQVWNAALTGDAYGRFLGEGVDGSVRKVSYAASLGDGVPETAALARLKGAVGGFAAVSVREPKLAALLDGTIEAKVTLDPTLLLQAGDYAEVSTRPAAGRPYLYVYTLYHKPEAYKRAAMIAAASGLELVYTPLYQYTRWGMPRGTVLGVTPDRFAGYMAGAACVMTDSFHGTVFALLNRKPFITYRLVRDCHESRPAALLGRLGLDDRLMMFDAPVGSMRTLLEMSVPEAAFARLEELRTDSLSWLRGVLGESSE